MFVARGTFQLLITILEHESVRATWRWTPRNICLFVNGQVKWPLLILGEHFFIQNGLYVVITTLFLALEFWTLQRKLRVVDLGFKVPSETILMEHMLASLEWEHFGGFLFFNLYIINKRRVLLNLLSFIVLLHTNRASLLLIFILFSVAEQCFVLLLNLLN